jgi:hypothetical protein
VCAKQHDRTETCLDRETGLRDDVCATPHIYVGPCSVGWQGSISHRYGLTWLLRRFPRLGGGSCDATGEDPHDSTRACLDKEVDPEVATGSGPHSTDWLSL